MFKALKSDADLWKEIRNDNGLAFDALFNRYWARLYKVAFYHLNDEEGSLEIVHNVFLSLWNRRKVLEINVFPGFLLSAIRYQIYTRLKSPKLSIAYKAGFEENDHLSELNLGDSHIREEELRQELELYLSQLPKRCHEIFYLSRIEHLSNQDIAERLGVSKKNRRKSAYNGFKALTGSF